MKIHKLLIGLLLLSILIILTACGSKESIKVGFIGPLTGGGALWGVGAKNMVEIAIDEINNNGGIGGKKLEVFYEDGKCNGKDAVTAVQKLIDVNNVKFILGGHCSPETVAIVPVIDQNKIFLLASITSSDNAVDKSDYAFRTSPSTLGLTKEMAKLVIKDYRDIALITEQAAFSKSVSDDFKKSFLTVGGEIISEEIYAPDQTDFKTQLLKIDALNPKAIFISPQNPNTATIILKQMKELNIDLPVLGNSILVSKKVYLDSNKGFDERAFSVIPYTDRNKLEARELENKYRKIFGTDVPYNFFYISASYDAVYMLKEAIKECGEDTDCVKDYFKEIKYKGISSDYQFKPNGDPYFNSWAEIRVINGEEVLRPL
ncbi:ABC transporter substrate-binding protein [Candidatus Woesearchaeota archaeon]|nr:ABC transporter substrate-binding protein [Candidatus Woesearchaeota archaeon]